MSRTRLGTLVLFVLLVVGSLGAVDAVARPLGTPVKTFLCPSQDILIASDAGVEEARFRMALQSHRFGSHHSGGANFVLGDGSVRFVRATVSRFVFDRQGRLVEIAAEMIDPQGSGPTWAIQILPYIEQDNLYRFHVSVGDRRFEYDAVGRLLPAETVPRR